MILELHGFPCDLHPRAQSSSHAAGGQDWQAAPNGCSRPYLPTLTAAEGPAAHLPRSSVALPTQGALHTETHLRSRAPQVGVAQGPRSAAPPGFPLSRSCRNFYSVVPSTLTPLLNPHIIRLHPKDHHGFDTLAVLFSNMP